MFAGAWHIWNLWQPNFQPGGIIVAALTASDYLTVSYSLHKGGLPSTVGPTEAIPAADLESQSRIAEQNAAAIRQREFTIT
jgi:hypothetical protein